MYNWCSDGTSLLLLNSFSFAWHFTTNGCMPYLFRPKILDRQQQRMPLGKKQWITLTIDKDMIDCVMATRCAMLLYNSVSFAWHFAVSGFIPYLFRPTILDCQQQQMPLGSKSNEYLCWLKKIWSITWWQLDVSLNAAQCVISLCACCRPRNVVIPFHECQNEIVKLCRY